MPKKAPDWLNDDIKEFYNPSDVNIRAIQRAIQDKRGVEIPYMTVTTRMKQLGLERPRDKSKKAKEATMSDETTEVPELLPGKMSLETADIPAEVHYGAVSEFDALPEGYAKTIQPMQPYSAAEEWALDKSMELYGFIGAIVRDQYGRILDGNQRQRIARLRGLSVPHTIMHVRDDAHAIEIARTLNTIRRHYTKEQREELAPIMRDQGFSYRAIAEALGVGKSTVYRDVFGELRIQPEPEADSESVPNGTPDSVKSDAPVPNGTPGNETGKTTQPSPPKKTITGRDGRNYPDRKPPTPKTTTTTPKADRQVARVIDLLMNYAQQWDDKHWQAFLDVVQTLRGNREVAAHT